MDQPNAERALELTLADFEPIETVRFTAFLVFSAESVTETNCLVALMAWMLSYDEGISRFANMRRLSWLSRSAF
ncbi:MAG: hypothetical protein JO145_14895 [Acidobacteriaceae bacterium]|nr:hypothetical protein [Acidobacteriaceae bacterium]MBV9407144.1 hypothetical protein [Acidobacteriaceae bacterium]